MAPPKIIYSSGPWRLAEGRSTKDIKVDVLAECSEAEVAAYEAELARWASLRAQFKQGVHAKTAEGLVGAVIQGAAAGGHHANEVQLRLADCSPADLGVRLAQPDRPASLAGPPGKLFFLRLWRANTAQPVSASIERKKIRKTAS